MKEQKMIQWVLFLSLIFWPTALFSEVDTGYDGAGNYIEDTIIDEKKN